MLTSFPSIDMQNGTMDMDDTQNGLMTLSRMICTVTMQRCNEDHHPDENQTVMEEQKQVEI